MFLQNINKPHPYFFSEAWSLSIEEWFYISVPAAIFFLVAVVRLSVKSAVTGAALAVILITIAYRFYVFQNVPVVSMKQWDDLLRKEVLTRLDSIMVGVTGAYAAYYYKEFWCRYKVAFLIAGILILLSMKLLIELRSAGMMFFLSVPYFTINAYGILLLLPWLSALETGKGAIYRAITYISLISYSMYLLNFSFVQEFVLRQIDFYTYSFSFLMARYFLFWAFTISGAAILYKLIEKPFMALRSK